MDEKDEIRKFLSPVRLRPYEREARSFLEAIAGYEENILFCTRFFVAVHFLEIALRNEINDILGQGIGPDWFLRPNALIHPQTEQLKEANRQLHKQSRKHPSRDDLVAKLPLGFWVGILNARYEKQQQYWRRFLHKGFRFRPKGYDRKQLFNRYDSIRHFRNRVFHHDRILHRKSAKKLSECLEAIGWISPYARDWAQEMLDRIP